MSSEHNLSSVSLPAVAIFCSIGCCPGCQDCYGMSIGCHQDPCRCAEPCSCRYADEDADPRWRAGCVRHDSTGDRRGERDADPYDDGPPDLIAEPCPECGETGACAYDDEGRALIHVTTEDGDE